MTESVLSQERRMADRVVSRDAPETRESTWRSRAAFVLFLTLWAFLCELVLKYPIWWGDSPLVAVPALLNGTHLVGVLFLLTVVVWLLALSGRLWVALATSLCLCVCLSVATHIKLSTLVEPVVPYDAHFITQPEALMTGSTWRAAGMLGLLLVSIALGTRYTMVRAGHRVPALPRLLASRLRATRLVTVLVLGALLMSSFNFNRAELNPWGRLAALTDPVWRPWDQLRNYQLNGFVAGFLYNMPVEAMEKPPRYSAEALESIARRYDDAAQPSPASEPPNIVVVLSEAFTDPRSVPGYSLDEDVIPRIREVMETSWSGRVIQSAYGHGTSAAEFEVLTSQPIGLFEPQMTTPYQMLIPGMDSYPSVVNWAEGHGYSTTAIHPYSPKMYRRIPVYEALGFDEFLYDEKMAHRARLESNPYISDASAFEEVLDEVRSAAQPKFVHLITMQNHFPTDGHYDDPPDVNGVEGETVAKIAGYARGLAYTDIALAEFLGALSDLGEETVVVFFGDHHPPIYNQQILGAVSDRKLRETPFFIWSSTGQPQHKDLGVVSPTRLLPLAFERAGIDEPAMYRLVDDFGAQVGALHGPDVVTPTGRIVQRDLLSPDQAGLLEDMRMVQYDLSVGQRYGSERLWR